VRLEVEISFPFFFDSQGAYVISHVSLAKKRVGLCTFLMTSVPHALEAGGMGLRITPFPRIVPRYLQRKLCITLCQSVNDHILESF